jgi:Domain of unknown function (DUF5004)
MKKITFIIAIIGLLLFAACKPAAIKDYETFSAADVTSFQGQWKITKVTQTDEDSKRKLFPYKVVDLTSTLNMLDIRLILNLNGGVPAAFTANYGAAPQIFKIAGGTWKVDDNKKPGKLWLINGTDTSKFTIGAYSQLQNNKMSLKQVKSLGSTEMITYEYEFSKN